jgi:hemolysin III
MMNKFQDAFITRPIEKPLLRGVSHQAAFFFALGAGLMLLNQTKNLTEFISILVYSLSLCFLFGVSALYHLPNWAKSYRVWMKRLDHCAIYLLIAGTGTPICLLGLKGESGKHLLMLTWSMALFGLFQSLVWVHAPKWVSALLYLIAGWLVVPFWSEIKEALSFNQILFIILGGVAYSVGAFFYALKKPNPIPRVLGYHELFHFLVIVGAFFQFLSIKNFLS